MERTRRAKFLVHEPEGSAISGQDNDWYVWFEVLESDDQGKRVRVPIFELYYDNIDPEVLDVIESLGEGDVVSAVLEREDNNDFWTPTAITEV